MSEPKKIITLFYGGDVNVGRRMNFRIRETEPFVDMKEMEEADVRLVNLECVVAGKGQQAPKFDSAGPFYIHARPEQMNILVKADIDIVLTANNHAGDYGRSALLEQNEYLDKAGILHAGSGRNISEAFAPVYKKVGGIVIAVFSIDFTYSPYAASKIRPGIAHLSTKLLDKNFAVGIGEARKKADVVIVAPHWGSNYRKRPSERIQQLARMFIDSGADAVLGCHAHRIQGVENYKNRPIIYDAGDLLFDTPREDSCGCFTLEISSNGVEKVKFIPLVTGYGQTARAVGKQAKTNIKIFADLCKEFNTDLITDSGKDFVEISFNPPPRELKVIDNPEVVAEQEKHLIEPLAEPRPEWIVDKVPDKAIIPPQNFGSLKLVGYYVPPDCRTVTKRKMLQVETYWTIDKPFDKDCRLSIRGVPVRECNMPPYGDKIAHEFLDYMWSVNRWKPGVIYREKIGLLPPQLKFMANVDLQVEIKVTADSELIGEFKDTDIIKMQVEDVPFYNTEFDKIIYQSELGKCWTSEQLAKVTGGEWIVPPPEGWYVQTLSRNDKTVNSFRARPTLFLADIIQEEDSRAKILENIDKLDGAIITHDVEGLPPDFPLLKVTDSVRAMCEIGFAARKCFQGKVIAVTGSTGKIITCKMLNRVLGKDHKVTASLRTNKTYSEVLRSFASVKQDDAYAIIEVPLVALNKLRGPITYEITPQVAVVTSIAPTVGNKNSLDIIAKYKSRIFCGMTAGSYAVINRDMPYYELFEQKAKSFALNIITFGTHTDATIRMPVLADGGEFSVTGKTYKLFCPVPAKQLYNALAVLGVSLAVGIPLEKTLDCLNSETF